MIMFFNKLSISCYGDAVVEGLIFILFYYIVQLFIAFWIGIILGQNFAVSQFFKEFYGTNNISLYMSGSHLVQF